MIRRLLVPLVAAAVAVAVPVTAAFAVSPRVAPAVDVLPLADPPSVAQICAATSIDTVDAYLASLAESQLVGDLAPLVSLTVPRDASGLKVKSDVSLERVRVSLDCTDDTPPTTTPAPTTSNPPGDDDDDDSDDHGHHGHHGRHHGKNKCCTQVDITPKGGVDTGDGTTLIVE